MVRIAKVDQFTNSKRVVIYARYSDHNQREESIAAQLRFCREYCRQRGYIIVAEYTDEALTGRKDDRPDFQRMIRDAKSGNFDLIVCHKVNRFSRDKYDDAHYKKMLLKVGVRVVFAAQEVEDSKEGRFMETILVGQAQYESENLAEEVMKGMMENAHKGIFNGGRPPYGYDVKDQQYIINETEAPAIRVMYPMFTEGFGYTRICAALTDRGYRYRKNKPFTKSILQRLLPNPCYKGTYVFGRRQTINGKRIAGQAPLITIENALPAIVSPELWAAAQERVVDNRKRAAAYKAKRTYMLTGKIICGVCGGHYVGQAASSPKSPNINVYYLCTRRSKQNGGCGSKLVRQDVIESYVWEMLDDLLHNPARFEETIAAMAAEFSQQQNTDASELQALEKEKQQVIKKLNNLLDAIEDGQGNKEIKARVADYSLRITQLENRIRDINIKPQQITAARDKMIEKYKKYRELLQQGNDPEIRKQIAQAFIKRVTVLSNPEDATRPFEVVLSFL